MLFNLKFHTNKSILFFVIQIVIIFVIILSPFIIFGSFEEGYELYKKGKYYEAEKILLREKELSPKNLDIYAVLGWIYLYTNRYSKAIDISEEGLKISSTDTRLITNIGRAYLYLKRYKEAISYFQKSISINPKYSYNYYYLGRIYLDMAKYLLAETAFSAAISLKNDRYIFYMYRGEAYEKMGKYQDAEKDYKKALTLNPNNPRLKEALIRVIAAQAPTQQEAE